MKILILQDDLPPYHAGGAGVIAYEIAKGFRQSGHEVLIVTTVQDRSLAGREVRENIEIEKLFSSYHERWRGYLSVYNPQVIPALKEIIKKWQPDIVHAHNIHYYLSYHSLKIAARSGAKVFLTAHDVMLFQYGKTKDMQKIYGRTLLKTYRWRFNPFRNYCIRYYLHYVSVIIAVSQALKNALNNNGITGVSVIYNGIDAEKWKEPEASVETFKTQHNLRENVILFGGRLSGLKGGEKVIKALEWIAKTLPDVQLLVIGQKDVYAKKMLLQGQEEGVADKIVFTGWISGHQLRQAYRASSVVVVPSLYLDPFPTVNLEAMASAKPVIATCYGGSSEVVRDGETGYVVDPFKMDILAEKIKDLLLDKNKNRLFGEAGFKRVSEEFTLTGQVKQYEKLFINSYSSGIA